MEKYSTKKAWHQQIKKDLKKGKKWYKILRVIRA